MLKPDTPLIKILLDDWRKDIERYERKEGHNTNIVKTNKHRISEIYDYTKDCEAYIAHLEGLLEKQKVKVKKTHATPKWDGVAEAQKHLLQLIQKEAAHPDVFRKIYHKEAKRQISINLAKKKWSDHYE